MSHLVVPVFYALVAIATLWLALLWLTRVKLTRRTRIATFLIGVVTIWMLFVPLGGLPLWSRAFSFFPNPSFPLLGLVCAALWRRLLGTPCFKPEDWRAVWIFGALAGSVLYLHPMLFGSLDLYYWGWHRESAAWMLAVLAVLTLGWGSRLGVLFVAALLGYSVNALESQNCWDYLMDPIYWLISVAVVGIRGCGWVVSVWKQEAYD
jgi:hypothetical protein